jgi:hypothetical protein
MSPIVGFSTTKLKPESMPRSDFSAPRSRFALDGSTALTGLN